MAFRPMSEPGKAFSDAQETIVLHWSHHLDSITSLLMVVFSAGGGMSSMMCPLFIMPFLPPRSVLQHGHDSSGIKCVSSGMRSDLPTLPHPGLFSRFFFLPVIFGFGLPSLSYSGFFELGWLISLIFCPAFSLSIASCCWASCSLSSIIRRSFSSS